MLESPATLLPPAFQADRVDEDDPFGELSVEMKEIRILKLHPGISDEPLVGTLRRTSALNPCSYEALSWCWGLEQPEGNSQAAIVLNSRPVQIRTPLASALRMLRQVGTSRNLWIDAICIRQDQTANALREKAEQVQLMAEIFRSAEKVLMWIDPELHLLKRTLPLLDTLADPTISHKEALGSIEAAQEAPWTNPGVSPQNQVGECTALQWLLWLSRFPYWRRMWVVQEVALARHAAIVCGQDYLDFDHLVKAYGRMQQLEIELFNLDANIAAWMAIIEQSIGLFRDCRRQVASGCSPLDEPLNVSDDPNVHELRQDCMRFVGFLSMCRSQLSTDPRDKVYGLLGLSSEAFRNLIMPRYTISALKLVLDLIQVLVQETRSLFPLSQAVGYWFEDEIPRHSGPSWLPHWTAQKNGMIEYEQAKYRLRQQSLFQTCGRNQADIVKFEADKLMVKGVIIDCISSAQTYSRWQEGRYLQIPNLDFLMSWLSKSSAENLLTEEETSLLSDAVFHRLSLPKVSYHRLQGQEIERIFWQTWSHDQEPAEDLQGVRRRREDFSLRSRDWRQQYTRWAQNGRDVPSWQGPGPNLFGNDLWGSFDVTLHHSRLFFTQDGFLGLTAKPILPGDKVCVLAGGHLPFILRPSEQNSNRFRLVCECFVEGIMDGEATENGQWSYQSRRSPELNQPKAQRHEILDVKWEEIILV